MRASIEGGAMRKFIGTALLAAIVLCGCGNPYHLKYEAMPQPKDANLFADISHLSDGIEVSVDTDGRRLEEIFIKKADGTVVHPEIINFPKFEKSASVGTGVGVGIGPVGVGTGVGVPVGPERARGVTTARFKASEIGESPWELHVKVHGIAEAVIPGVSGKATAK